VKVVDAMFQKGFRPIQLAVGESVIEIEERAIAGQQRSEMTRNRKK